MSTDECESVELEWSVFMRIVELLKRQQVEGVLVKRGAENKQHRSSQKVLLVLNILAQVEVQSSIESFVFEFESSSVLKCSQVKPLL